MLLSLLLCNTLFIPIISGNVLNPTVELNKNETKTLVTKQNSDSPAKEENKLNLTLFTESGAAIQSTPSLTLLKQNQTNLLNLDKELGKDKSSQSSVSKIVPRKGVDYQAVNTTAANSSVEIQHVDDTDKKLKSSSGREGSKSKSTKTPEVINSNLQVNKSKVEYFVVTEKVNKTAHIKKPTVLSDIALAKTDEMQAKILPAIQSSSRTIVQDQMPSPSHSASSGKMQSASSRHPGMIMPVVITILVVPMFAVLGYMALKRGQEAWKNRHYKRMDFLLDGMYNE